MNRPRPLAASPWLRALLALTFTLSVALAGFAPGANRAQAVSTSVVISQFQVAGATAADEFVELHNVGSAPFDLNGHRLVYRSAAGTSDVNLVAWTTSTVIPAGGFYLVTIAVGYDDTVTADATFSTGSTGAFAGASGGLALRNGATNTGTIVDSVGYGSATNAFVEGAATPAPAANASRVRINNSCADTDNNAADFAGANPATPRNAASPALLCGAEPTATTATTTTPTPETPTPVTPTPETPTATPDACTGSATPIPAVQGSGDITPFSGQTVTVRGVVAADFQGSNALNGFNLQDPVGDGDPATSDGIFVFIPTANPLSSIDVAVGDVVTVTGRATEFQGLTEIDNVSALTKCGTAAAPTPVALTLPETTNGELERYEGMLVSFAQTLTAQQNFFQGRFGQVTLGVGRLFQPTNSFPAGSPDAIAAADLNARSLLVLDDGRSNQNPNPIPYIGQDNTLRAGDTVSGIVGLLDFGPINSNSNIRDYRIHPTGPVSFTRVNERTPAPEPVGGNVQVASFNVLNYFNGDGQGGGFPTSRGADSLAEFERQRTKIIAALAAIDADVVGLMEIENDGAGSLSAIQDLVNGLNAASAPGTYALVAEPAPGSDEIKVALIYKPGVVTPVGAAQNYQTSDPTYGAALFDRPPLAQTFSLNANGARFSVVVNHFKSKGSCPSSGVDTDQGDGQGCWNAKRVRQSQELLGFVGQLQAASGDQDVLVIGDLNAYGAEDPIQVLTAAGMVNQLAARVPNPYSYVFDGLAGYLDHAVATASLDGQVSGVTVWSINADEPSVIDYNTEFKPQDLYAPNAYKASDHDPVIVGLNLAASATPTPETPTATPTTPTATPETPTVSPTTPTASPTTPTATPGSADVVISQVYGAGGNSGATFNRDYVELYNRGSAPVSLSGWSLQYTSASGTGNFSGGVAPLSGTIQPGGYFLVGLSSGNNGVAIPTPDATGTIAMGATAGKILLASTTDGIACNGGSSPCSAEQLALFIDLVGFGSANFFEGSGPAPAPSTANAIFRKNGGATDTNNNSADFEALPANPRNSAGGTPTPTPTTATPTPTTPTATPTTPTATPDPCQASFTPIFTIQGSGASAAVTGNVTTRGVVVGDFDGPISAGLQGFYIQDPIGDGNPATSDGIFVYTGNEAVVSAGQLVRVTGFARERFNQTTINGSDGNNAAVPAANIVVCGSGSVAPVDVELPFASATDPERYEGMLVRFPQALQITEYFNYDRFGEVALGLPLPGEPRLFSPTVLDEPGAAAQARAAANALRRITLDDGLGVQNPNITRHPNGQPFTLSNRFRGGDTVQNAVGVLAYDFNLYRIQPTGPAEFTAQNPRPAAPEPVGGDLKVSAFNTLNYFLTLDYPSGNPLDNACGPLNNVECRGADDSEEFERQRAKLLAAIVGLDADVLGLNELENSAGVEPLADIVAGLNQQLGAGSYAFIDTGTIGTDAIKVGFIYQPGKVTPVGPFKLLTTAVDPRFLDTKNRPVLAQTFEEVGTGARFTVAVAHFKSKGSDCNDVGDPDAGDGAGNCNGTRTKAAQALVDWLASDPTGSGDPDFLIVGDLNSYAKEDPIDAILAGPDDTAGTADDYTNLIAAYGGPFAYSYVFDGQFGYLDHALASASMVSQVTGATEWHINADEPDLLDYDTTFKSSGQDALYEPNAYRTSDHDPVQVGLSLAAPPNVAPTVSASFNAAAVACQAASTLTVTFSDPNPADTHSAVIDWGDGSAPTSLANVTSGFTASRTYARAGSYTATVTVTDNRGASGQASATTAVTYTVVGGGLLPPINQDGSSIFRYGRTVPVKVQLQDCNGSFPSNLAPTIAVTLVSGNTPGPITDPGSTGEADTGGVLRYDAASKQYIYNLRTRGLPDSTGTYRITITVPATGQTIVAEFGLR